MNPAEKELKDDLPLTIKGYDYVDDQKTQKLLIDGFIDLKFGDYNDRFSIHRKSIRRLGFFCLSS